MKVNSFFPSSIWSGLSRNKTRKSLLTDLGPNFQDWDQIVSEVLAIENHLASNQTQTLTNAGTINSEPTILSFSNQIPYVGRFKFSAEVLIQPGNPFNLPNLLIGQIVYGTANDDRSPSYTLAGFVQMSPGSQYRFSFTDVVDYSTLSAPSTNYSVMLLDEIGNNTYTIPFARLTCEPF